MKNKTLYLLLVYIYNIFLLALTIINKNNKEISIISIVLAHIYILILFFYDQDNYQ